MTEQQTKQVVVVLSPGRCGTSLLMKALGAMGMSLSENMIPGSVGNPEGFFEDIEIVEVHKQLLSDLDTLPTLPLPEGWLEAEPTKKARQRLRKILQNRLAGSNAIWGFKDPRTVAFLPLWNRILNAPGTVPVFILAIRNPAAVAVSLNRQINRENIITELQWLLRTTDALHHTAADCFVIHYEDWFTRPVDQAQGLLRYTGLDQYFSGSVEEALKDVIKPNLNRAVYEDYEVQNEYVLKLYDVLKDCRGDDFDRARLMGVVKECRKAMHGFKGWYLEAQKRIGQQDQNRGKLKSECGRAQELDKRVREMETDLHEITLQNNEYLKQLKDLHDESESLRVRDTSLIKENKDKQQTINQLKADHENELENIKSKLAAAEEHRATKQQTIELLKAELELNEQQIKIEQHYKQHLFNLNKWLLQLEKDYYALKKSLRWKIGNFLVAAIELPLFRFSRPKATDHIEEIFSARKYWNSSDIYTIKDVNLFLSWLKQAEKDLNAILASKRWALGNGILSLVDKLFLRGQKPTVQGHFKKIIEEFHSWEKTFRSPEKMLDHSQKQIKLKATLSPHPKKKILVPENSSKKNTDTKSHGPGNSPKKNPLINTCTDFSNKENHVCNLFKPFKPFEIREQTDLNIAFTGSSYLEKCLSFDALLTPLKVDNWKTQLEQCSPDFLLVESEAKNISHDGSLSLLQIEHSQIFDDILKHCKAMGIPTVFWHTEPVEHACLYLEDARKFDHVFAVEEDAVQFFAEQGISNPLYLPAAVQPALHNPITYGPQRATFQSLIFFYDGWADLLEYPNEHAHLLELVEDGLVIVESTWTFKANKLKDLPEYTKNILGCLDYEQRLSALKQSKICIMGTPSLKSAPQLTREALEAVASKTPVIFRGALDSKLLKGLVHFAEDDQKFLDNARMLMTDDLYRERTAHQAWREVFTKHTYAQRLNTLCSKMGIDPKTRKHAHVTAVTVTKRPHMLENAKKNYQCQNYPFKDWIVILNTIEADKKSIEEQLNDIPEFKVLQIAPDKNIGFCLNLAMKECKGEYWTKMDDDDFYGPDYISDYMLMTQSVDADLLGKRAAYTYFEQENGTYLRGNPRMVNFIADGKYLHLCGATFTGKKEIFKQVPFSEDIRSAVDSTFFQNCQENGLRICFSDSFNMIIFRSSDLNNHTWRHGDVELKAKAAEIGEGLAMDKVMI